MALSKYPIKLYLMSQFINSFYTKLIYKAIGKW